MIYIANIEKSEIVELKSIKIEKESHSCFYRNMTENERKEHDATLRYNLIINENFVPYAKYKTYEKATAILNEIINKVNNESNFIYELKSED